MRQIWRNHLLGLSMVAQGDICSFHSVTVYPAGNRHFQQVLPEYLELLQPSHRSEVISCTFEDFIATLSGSEQIQRWQRYLTDRYIVDASE